MNQGCAVGNQSENLFIAFICLVSHFQRELFKTKSLFKSQLEMFSCCVSNSELAWNSMIRKGEKRCG